MTRAGSTIAMLTMVSILAGCATPGSHDGVNKQDAGTLLGALGGAVAGAQFGKGSGKIVGAVAGTLVGGFIGNQIGASLDKADQAHLEQAHNRALAAPIGEQIVWNNPQSGNSGTIVPTREGYSKKNNEYCREYQQKVTVAGKTQSAFGQACRQPDGSWKIVSQE